MSKHFREYLENHEKKIEKLLEYKAKHIISTNFLLLCVLVVNII